MLTPPTLGSGTLVLPLGAAAALPRRLWLWLCGLNTTRILAWHDAKAWLESSRLVILSERGRDRRGLE